MKNQHTPQDFLRNPEGARTRVELLPRFQFTGKTVKNTKFADNYR